MNSLIFQYGSAVVGGLAILSVCLVFVKQQTFKKEGFGLLVVGTILIGLPVWSSAKFVWNIDGLAFEFETITQKLSSLEEQVELSGSASREVKSELAQLANAFDKIQSTNNLALATFASDPYSAIAAASPLANAYSISLTTGGNSRELTSFFSDSEEALKNIKNTEALTEELNTEVKEQATTEHQGIM